jgi:hypothetical protein
MGVLTQTTAARPQVVRDGMTGDEARAAAVRLAREGELGDALEQLTSAWAGERSRTLDDDAADIATLHLASGHPLRAFAALELGVRGRTHVGGRARRVLAQCVAEQPRRVWRALAIACSAGSMRDRVMIGGAVVAARIRPR